MIPTRSAVIPAKAGIHLSALAMTKPWVPAYAGTTLFMGKSG
jgi:hypothetical protein